VHWSQTHTPLGSVGVSALFIAAGIAIVVYGMPARPAFASAGYGAAFGLLPIGWLILNAIFIYQLSVETGQFAVLQKQISGLYATGTALLLAGVLVMLQAYVRPGMIPPLISK